MKAVQDLLDLFSIHCIPKAENVRANWPVNVAMDEIATMGWKILIVCEKKVRKGPKIAFKATAQPRSWGNVSPAKSSA